MKNLKKGLALVLSFAMILSTFTISFAEEAKYATEAQALMDLGLVAGKDGDLALNDGLTKQEAIVLMASIFDWDCAEDDEIADAPFEDVANWAYAEVAYAKENGIVAGVDATHLGDKFTRKELTILFLRQLGYEVKFDTSVTVENAVKAGILTYAEVAEIDGSILRSDAFGMAYKTLKATPVDSTETVIEQLINANKVDAVVAENVGLYEKPAPEALEIENIEATNLKEITVTYNRPVDKAAAEEKDNYDLSPSRKIIRAELQDDGITTLLTISDVKVLDNNKEYTLKVENMKTVDEEETDKLEGKFKSNDCELPRVESVEFTGPDKMDITFSEPVEEQKGSIRDCVEVYDGNKKVGTKSPEFNDNKLSIKLSKDLSDGKDYTINITNIEDYNDLTNYPYRETLTYVKVDELPTAEVIAVDQEIVEINFSKPLRGLTSGAFYHGWSGNCAYHLYETLDGARDEDSEDEIDVADHNKYYSKVFAVFTDDDDKRPLNDGTVEFTIKSKDNYQLEDAWGNEFPGETYFIEVTADRSNPVFVDYEVLGADSLKLNFSKEMNEKELTDKKNYTLYDDDDKEQKNQIQTLTPKNSGKSVQIDFRNDDWEGKTITLEIKNLKDDTLHENPLDTIVEEITLDDKANDGDILAYYEAGDYPDSEAEENDYEGKLFLMYDEDMNDTVTDLDNYKYEYKGKTEEFDDEPDFYSGSSVVCFDLSGELIGKDFWEAAKRGTLESENSSIKIQIGRVEDEDGNKSEDLAQSVNVALKSESAPYVKEIKVTELDEVVLKYSQKLLGVDFNGSNYKVYLANDSEKENLVEDADVDGKEITLTLGKKLGRADAKNLVVETESDSEAINDVEQEASAYDPTSRPLTIKDEVAPTVVTLDEDEDDEYAVFYTNELVSYSGTTCSQIFIAFNEKVDDLFHTTNVDVSGYDVKDVEYINSYVDDGETKECSVLKIYIEDNDKGELEDGISVTLEELVDCNKNKIDEDITVETRDYSSSVPEPTLLNVQKNENYNYTTRDAYED